MSQLLDSHTQHDALQLTDQLDATTLLFADIAGFTEYCSDKSPQRVLQMLQNIFVSNANPISLASTHSPPPSGFDKACLQHEVYKLYTIGDCYVVMGTINKKKREIAAEARRVLSMAFSMLAIIEDMKAREDLFSIDIRIGIHTGDIMGSIIGTDIVRYDVYGTHVVIANQMEASSQRGRVLVSTATYELL